MLNLRIMIISRVCRYKTRLNGSKDDQGQSQWFDAGARAFGVHRAKFGTQPGTPLQRHDFSLIKTLPCCNRCPLEARF